MEISARLKEWPESQPSVKVNYDLPEDLDGLVSKFGKDVVASKAVDSLVIDVQALVRRQLRAKDEKDRTPEAIQAKVNEYVPSAGGAVRRSPQEKIEDLASKLSPEEKKALIASLRDSMKVAA